MNRTELSREVARRLLEEYGHRRRTREDPTDVLMRTVLSQNTSDVNSHRAFASLKKRFPALPELASARTSEIEDAIRVGGLYVRKARIIRQIARRALQKPVSLDEMDNERAREYLKSIDGVGSKTASCVLLFALGREVFPVDTHVFRLTKRLGLLDEAVPFDRADEALEEFVPGGIRYDLHINLIQHGRGVCRPSRPRCRGCVLLDLCPHGRRMEGMDRDHDGSRPGGRQT